MKTYSQTILISLKAITYILHMSCFFRLSRSPIRGIQPVVHGPGDVELQPTFIEEGQVMDLLRGLAQEMQSLRDEMRGRAELTMARQLEPEVTLVPVSTSDMGEFIDLL